MEEGGGCGEGKTKGEDVEGGREGEQKGGWRG